jgi:regulator of protease activity HflC (stomatin/prohibitin superfamily)
MEYVALIFGLAVLYCGWGFTIVRPRQVKVVERSGKFKKMCFEGWHILCLPGLVDKVTVSKNQKHNFIPILQRFPVVISVDTDGKPKPFDFSDGVTATADVRIWVQVGFNDPNKTPEENRRELECDVKAYVYGSEDAKDRVRALGDNISRPLIQEMTLAEALEDRSLEDNPGWKDPNVQGPFEEALKQIGLYLAKPGTITVGDIDVPTSYQDIRSKVAKAQAEAEARNAEARSIRDSAEIIAKGYSRNVAGDVVVNSDEGDVTIADALAHQRSMKALDAIDGAKLTLVHPSIGAGVASMLDMADNAGNKNAPKP